MKIKLAILERDQSYLGRIVAAFSTKYAEKFEVYSFTDANMALATLDEARIDVLLAGDSFEIDVTMLPKRCGFAYLVDSAEVESINNQRAICKFQKADLIYKQILSIYAESSLTVSGLRVGDEKSKVLIFSSPCGGVGTSSMAAACAMHFAAKGKRALYLNLEKYGSSDAFFSAEGQFDMSDIIYALKSKKTNLSMKLESCVKQDASGVYFYSQTKLALDMLEIDKEDILRLISELKLMGSYDYIIIDLDFSMTKDKMKVYKQAQGVIWVGDGSATSNSKIARAFTALSIMEQNADLPLNNRVGLVYNKFSSKTGKAVEGVEITNIGGAPKYEHATEQQVLAQLAEMSFFDKVN